jgi:proteasome lid subunit RPN8/RPN11
VTRAATEGRFDLERDLYNALVEHACNDFPYEVCGLLAGVDGRVSAHYRVPNAARSMTYYNMEPRALLHAMNDMDEHDWDLLAIYHSHTHTEAFPSPTDVELAFYPDAVYLIVSLQDRDEPVIRAFGIVDGRITERRLHIDGEEAPVGNR